MVNMYKKTLVLVLAVVAAGCGGAAPTISNRSPEPPSQRDRMKQETVIAHSADKKSPGGDSEREANGGQKKWTRSGDPIDTSEFDAAVSAAEMLVKRSPDDSAARKRLSKAYFDRGLALTRARQYASAIGDYRRALKNDPGNSEAKGWIDNIIMIYNGLNRSYPKEGEEPPPLEFKKGG